jgi:hypothetical protein
LHGVSLTDDFFRFCLFSRRPRRVEERKGGFLRKWKKRREEGVEVQCTRIPVKREIDVDR